MIFVKRVNEPADFDNVVRMRGNEWLKANPVKRPKDLWTPFRAKLAEGFKFRCAYSAMEIPYDGTVDHFLSCKHHRHLAYDWANYRYCLASINSRKKNRDAQILDPYEIDDGWFEVTILGFLVKITPKLPTDLKDKAKATIKILGLNRQEIIDFRLRQYHRYIRGQLTLEHLQEVAPLIAQAIIRRKL